MGRFSSSLLFKLVCQLIIIVSEIKISLFQLINAFVRNFTGIRRIHRHFRWSELGWRGHKLWRRDDSVPWRSISPRFRRRFDAICPKLPGYGPLFQQTNKHKTISRQFWQTRQLPNMSYNKIAIRQENEKRQRRRREIAYYQYHYTKCPWQSDCFPNGFQVTFNFPTHARACNNQFLSTTTKYHFLFYLVKLKVREGKKSSQVASFVKNRWYHQQSAD